MEEVPDSTEVWVSKRDENMVIESVLNDSSSIQLIIRSSGRNQTLEIPDRSFWSWNCNVTQYLWKWIRTPLWQGWIDDWSMIDRWLSDRNVTNCNMNACELIVDWSMINRWLIVDCSLKVSEMWTTMDWSLHDRCSIVRCPIGLSELHMS